LIESQNIPQDLAECALLRAGGFMVASMLSNLDIEHLLAESKRQELVAKRNVCLKGEAAEWRGGVPARAYSLAVGGQAQQAIHSSAATVDALRQIGGIPVALSGGGSYSYYTEPGDFLALHRDVIACDIALITCLETGPGSETGGRLLLYPGHIHQPLSVVREAGPEAAVCLRLKQGESVVLFGGLVPHEVLPVTARRVVSVACYRALSAPSR
jgi:hypothetical protein